MIYYKIYIYIIYIYIVNNIKRDCCGLFLMVGWSIDFSVKGGKMGVAIAM